MQCESRNEGSVLILRPTEKRVDARAAAGLKQAFSDAVSDGNNQIVLEMEEVEFVDSTGLGAIVAGLKLVGSRGTIVISQPKETVMTMFDLTRMSRVFQIFSQTDEAVAAISSSDN